MIGKRLLVLGLCLFVFISLVMAETKILKEDTVIQGIKCTGKIKLYESGKLKSATLGTWNRNTGRYTPIQIQGMKIWGGKIKLYESGKLKELYITNGSIKIQGICITKILFYESGKFKNIFFPEDIVIQGVKCKGDTHHYTVFYESGKLKDATLVENQIIQGIECWEGRDIEFYESGRIKRTYLVRSKKIQGIECWGDIEFYKDGKLKSAVLAKDQSVDGISYKKGMKIYFNKKLKVVSELEIKVIGEWKQEGDNECVIKFFENGTGLIKGLNGSISFRYKGFHKDYLKIYMTQEGKEVNDIWGISILTPDKIRIVQVTYRRIKDD